MSITINLNDPALFPRRSTTRSSRVWTKLRWNDAWTPRPDLHATQTVWSAFPEISTATLHYQYGWVCLPGENVARRFDPITSRGYWVLIAHESDDSASSMVWLGYAESPQTQPLSYASADPRSNAIASGSQFVPCFGMERLWDVATIEGTIATDPANEAKWTRFGDIAATFNQDGRGNRSATRKSLDETRTWQAYGFARPDEERHTWSTADIVQYLVGYHAPTTSRIMPNPDSAPLAEIPWRISGLEYLPNWDSPTITCDGRTVGDVLRQLVTPGRMASLAIGATATIPELGTSGLPVVTGVHVVAQTRLITPTTIPGIGSLPYDSGGVNLSALSDPLTHIDHQVDSSDVVDEVVVAGPREISVCTLKHGSKQWVNDWESGDQTAFDNGAADDPDWGDWTNAERSEANKRVRERASLQAVYRDLVLDPESDGTCLNGESIYPNRETGGNDDNPHTSFPGTHRVLSELPLYVGVDYSGDVDAVDESVGWQRRPILVSVEMPSENVSNKRDPLELIGDVDAHLPTGPFASMRPFTLEVNATNENGPGLRLNVGGAPRFVITASNGNEADGKGLDGYDYKTIETTVAMVGDRRPYYSIASGDLGSIDVPRRRLYVFEHAPLQMIYIPPGTVVEIDEFGDRKTSDGGILRNPLPRLQALASLLAAYAHSPRHRVTVETERRISLLPIGANLRWVDVAGVDVAAPVIEIRIDSPITTRPSDARSTQTITAASHRFDVMRLIEAGANR
ncbi:hypothetical protein RMSM_02563 [Rhodopirellula maiorica SM1]|uniref:Uncharacterized protein n=1 Tax=Rhodopirellula maiorica SM1 TaxID=1265738 RepID=M5RMV0_9BACT|nr:hypothetical protein RMSM_02563 [Rhodopirellula maiorica SM1]